MSKSVKALSLLRTKTVTRKGTREREEGFICLKNDIQSSLIFIHTHIYTHTHTYLYTHTKYVHPYTHKLHNLTFDEPFLKKKSFENWSWVTRRVKQFWIISLKYLPKSLLYIFLLKNYRSRASQDSKLIYGLCKRAPLDSRYFDMRDDMLSSLSHPLSIHYTTMHHHHANDTQPLSTRLFSILSLSISEGWNGKSSTVLQASIILTGKWSRKILTWNS